MENHITVNMLLYAKTFKTVLFALLRILRTEFSERLRFLRGIFSKEMSKNCAYRTQ